MINKQPTTLSRHHAARVALLVILLCSSALNAHAATPVGMNTKGVAGSGFSKSPGPVTVAGVSYESALLAGGPGGTKAVSWLFPKGQTTFIATAGLVDGCGQTAALLKLYWDDRSVTYRHKPKSITYPLRPGARPAEIRFAIPAQGGGRLKVQTDSPCVAIVSPAFEAPVAASAIVPTRPTVAKPVKPKPVVAKPSTPKPIAVGQPVVQQPAAAAPADSATPASPGPGGCAPRGATVTAQINDAIESCESGDFACARDKLDAIIKRNEGQAQYRAVVGVAHLWRAVVALEGRSDLADLDWLNTCKTELAKADKMIPKDDGYRGYLDRVWNKVHGYPRRIVLIPSIPPDSPNADVILRELGKALKGAFSTEAWEVVEAKPVSQLPSTSDALKIAAQGGGPTGFVVGLRLASFPTPNRTQVPYQEGKWVKPLFSSKKVWQDPVPAHDDYSASMKVDITIDDAVSRSRLVTDSLSASYSTPATKLDDTADNAAISVVRALQGTLASAENRSIWALVKTVIADYDMEGLFWDLRVKTPAGHSGELFRRASGSKRAVAKNLPLVLLLPPADLSANQAPDGVGRWQPLGDEHPMVLRWFNQKLRLLIAKTAEVSICGSTELSALGLSRDGLSRIDDDAALALAKNIEGCQKIVQPELHEAWYNTSGKPKVQIGLKVKVTDVQTGRSEYLRCDPQFKECWKNRSEELLVGNERGGSTAERPSMLVNASYRAGCKTLAGLLPRLGTPPTKPVVTCSYDGPSTLRASWVSDDPESGLAESLYAFDENPNPDLNRLKWKSTSGTEVTETGMKLKEGRNYYCFVKSRNGVDVVTNWGEMRPRVQMWSEVGVSNPVEIPDPKSK